MKKLAIIGASYLQLPLILKAKSMGIETHVFAWAANDVGEKEADYFYPISIIEKDEILNKCKEINIDGICSIATDLGIVTVNYVAQNMGLISNDLECTLCASNKHVMRRCFEQNGDPSPKSILVENMEDLKNEQLEFPLIVKPLDRSGSRGIYKVNNIDELTCAIDNSKQQGFIKKALVEEFAQGNEYSVECISFGGVHTLLQITYKYTTNEPHFIETGHLEPAPVSLEIKEKVKNVVFHALNSLGIKYGASHSELKIDLNGNIKLIEIGGRMGGDFIGSSLVELSTGYDFVKAVIDVALGNRPDAFDNQYKSYSAVRFIFNKEDLDVLKSIENNNPEIIVQSEIFGDLEEEITDSSNRHGYYIMRSNSQEEIYKYLPEIPVEVK